MNSDIFLLSFTERSHSSLVKAIQVRNNRREAGVAQWQSSGFVNRWLEVRFLSPAPFFVAAFSPLLDRQSFILRSCIPLTPPLSHFGEREWS